MKIHYYWLLTNIIIIIIVITIIIIGAWYAMSWGPLGEMRASSRPMKYYRRNEKKKFVLFIIIVKKKKLDNFDAKTILPKHSCW